jgi:hypothetical protein
MEPRTTPTRFFVWAAVAQVVLLAAIVAQAAVINSKLGPLSSEERGETNERSGSASAELDYVVVTIRSNSNTRLVEIDMDGGSYWAHGSGNDFSMAYNNAETQFWSDRLRLNMFDEPIHGQPLGRGPFGAENFNRVLEGSSPNTSGAKEQIDLVRIFLLSGWSLEDKYSESGNTVLGFSRERAILPDGWFYPQGIQIVACRWVLGELAGDSYVWEFLREEDIERELEGLEETIKIASKLAASKQNNPGSLDQIKEKILRDLANGNGVRVKERPKS